MSQSSEETANEPPPQGPSLSVTTPGLSTAEWTSPPIDSAPARSAQHVRYAVSNDADAPRPPGRPPSLTVPGSPVQGLSRSDTELSRLGIRRRGRSSTFKTIEEYEDYNAKPGWRPGNEPGVDTSSPDSAMGVVMGLSAVCQITIVDFSQDNFAIHELDNAQMIEFLQIPQPDWVKCRWINVNGLSWDVIQALGNHKNLHRLAVEDIMNTRNRTKVDWYQHHAFMVFTCQKLVRMVDDDDSSDEEEHSTKSHPSMKNLKKSMRRWWSAKKQDRLDFTANHMERGTSVPPINDFTQQATGLSEVFNPQTLHTLQRYQASSNEARNDFMERHSALAPMGLAVTAEQVSMFITSDNTVIAFFEQSADDIEKPILKRLSSPGTILRQSCDASMVAQAILDACIDMAIPVASCYADAIADLELDVLLHPSVKQTRSLYIVQSEINKMYSFISPIASIISAIRDHQSILDQEHATKELQNQQKGVIITPMTYTYLGDVYDHCILITENLIAVRKAADGMIDLIFNTISAYQNESMKQLTVVTIIFMPLTFLTGYFGQNFEDFVEIKGSPIFFWQIALPVTFGIILLLMREIIWGSVRSFFQRRKVTTVRKRQRKHEVLVKAQRKLRSSKTM